MNRLGILKAVFACSALLSAPAFAQQASLTIASVTANVGTNAVVAVTYAPPTGAGLPIGGFALQGGYTAALAAALSAAPTVTPGTGQTCSIDPVARTFNVGQLGGGTTASTVCTFTFPIAAAAPAGNNVISVISSGFSDLGGMDYAPGAGPTANPGAINIVLGPTAPTVGPLAALTLPAGPINLTATGSVPVSITGAGVATASLALACTIPATGASAFAVTSGGTQTINAPATVGPGTPIGVSCVRGAADVTATLTCAQTATPGPNPAALTAAITCPAGTTAPNPGSVPAAPGPIALIGPPAGTASASVAFTNTGGTLAYQVTACTPSAGYTTGTTAFPVNVGIGGTGLVGVSCTTPAASGTVGAPGTLACTTSAAGFNPTFNLTCTAQSASIPTLGFGGKALMVMLMLGFGLVGFQLYRRSA
jgi:hypothetical protein